MERYVAFLRDINVSGKNKIPMAQLKVGFEELGFCDVKTYLNSGNVIFSSDEMNIDNLISKIEKMINDKFELNISIYVLLKSELQDILLHSPRWWGCENKDVYDNLIFIIPPATFSRVFNEIGEPKEEFEKIENYKDVIFWSFDLKNYRKTNWWSKTASVDVSKSLTIRTVNTVKKLAKMD